ncbi:MAG: DUF5067 domain-containing protein [Oscillospiraceae bacterium]|nr:DUF5067 domain-containing protein [Oscillospiraceae bacterium]
MKKTLAVLLILLMTLSLAACGKGASDDPNLIKIGKYEALYTGCSIVTDSDGDDAIAITYQYTNNSKEAQSFMWAFDYHAFQNGVELEAACVYTNDDEDDYTMLDDDNMLDVQPGSSSTAVLTYKLSDLTSPVEMQFAALFGKEEDSHTIDLSTADATGATGSGSGVSASALSGDWYGWWIISDATGDYADSDGGWWDICAQISIGADGSGTIDLWDEDFKRSDVMGTVDLESTGEDTAVSTGGDFYGDEITAGEWQLAPNEGTPENLIMIESTCEDAQGSYTYTIYLRPWGFIWDDVEEKYLPYYYTDWYLPLVEANETMPDAIDTADAA